MTETVQCRSTYERSVIVYQDIMKYALAACFIFIALKTDYKECKIKNKHVLLFLAAGLIVNAIASGLAGLWDSLLGALAPLALLPLFILRMLGAGDIKALCAVGSIVRLRMSIYTVLFSIAAGGVIALGFMIFRRNARQRMKQFGSYLKLCCYMRKLLPYEQFADERSGFRFSLGIAGGFVVLSLCETLSFDLL